ncbi:RNA polymerase-binding transcription factor DksA [Natronocella acetinitrilica]|jgi:RNA polymerase-binding transcription factor DksA|uniref:RNA polymerase-binding transcription factor DksA n=1 Tax=Natronocella acetinitrilica TaxID=414046 RepID=A0AAE3KD66_9GAMM|nr:hypothetical protein [Natronocella acetinitrilica]MCP1676491.1 RNA polymerase-binding transcription factor DksA [Natronocella acetinitrilica]
MQQDLKQRRETLEKQRDALAERLRKINLDFRRGLDRDLDEQAQELENAEVLQEIARVTAEELNRIELALQRIEQAMRHQQQ